jgi:NADPH:quinone reductase-like Zn-dependent oxidoreductase
LHLASSVIQIAKYMGFSLIVTTASSYNIGHLKSLGATHVLDRFGDVASGIEDILNGHPVGVVYDSVHFPISQDEVDLVSPGGTLVSVAELPKEVVLDEGRRGVYVWGSVHLFKDAGREMYKELGQFLENGIIKVSCSPRNVVLDVEFCFFEADEGGKVEWRVGRHRCWTGENRKGPERWRQVGSESEGLDLVVFVNRLDSL